MRLVLANIEKIYGIMSKSAFTGYEHERFRGDPSMSSPFFRRQACDWDDTENFARLDESLRRSPHLVWQALSPNARADALRRAHLINLLRQVNPNLHVCRRPTIQMTTSTAEKGVQVPDVRYELPNPPRKPSFKKEQKVSVVAPGVKIQSRDTEDHHAKVLNGIDSEAIDKDMADKSDDLPEIQGSNVAAKSSGLKVTLKTLWEDRKVTNYSPKRKKSSGGVSKHATKPDSPLKASSPVITTDKPDENGNIDKQVNKSKEGSSGDDDSVVVVLDEPPSEQGLERKYGQFFCRRCLRGWSSRSVWCLRNTCKVYIKQTCNSCNKLVNPYLVCRLPKLDSKETK